LPDGLSDALIRKIAIDNPLAAFPRLASADAGQRSKQEIVQ
jgi:hypothetical protein